MENKQYIRHCPKCGIEITHKDKDSLKVCEGRMCRSCGNKGRIPSVETRNKLSEANKGQIPWILGNHHTEETIKKISATEKGKQHTEDAKRRMRIIKLQRVANLGISTKEDKGAKEYFDKLNAQGFNYKPKRFWDLGYDADGYDKEKHIWYEYDTPYHNHPHMKKKDLIRQTNIIEHFNSIGNPLKHFIRASADENGNVLSVTKVF
jgi:TusA-related sulfurtransferase